MDWREPLTSRRRLLILSGAPGAVALMAACGVAGGSQGGGAAGPGGAAGAPEKLVWSTFRGGGEGGRWRQMQIERYEAKFPRTKVDLQVLTQDYPKQFALAAAGTLGDVYAWDPSHWVFYDAINRRSIRPIDEYLKRDKVDLGQFYKPFIDYQKWDGKTWGLPSWGWTGHDGLLYNTELAQQAGVTFPDHRSAQWTMSTLYDIVVKLNRLVAPTGGFALSTTLPGAIAVTIFSRVASGDNLSPDGKRSLLLEARNKEALRWVYDLAHKEKAVATPGRFEGNVGDLFLNGKLAMEQAGSLSVFTRNKANPSGQLKFKAALFPRRQDGKRPSQLRGGTWNVGVESAGARSPDYAWELIKLITDREGALTLNTIGGEGALVRPDIMTDQYFQDPNFKVYLENFENTMLHVVPANFRGQEFETTVNNAGLPWYRGEVGHDDGLRTWNEETQRVLDQPALG
jgi:multiple sugar transport system substrate-binding protein